jgi:hypothetical protein
MSELPPDAGPPDDIDDRYRRAAALDPSQPGESVRRAVLEHAAKLAAERSAVPEAEDIPAQLGVQPTASNQRWWRPAIFGTLAAAALAGILIAPQYLPLRAPNTAAQSKIETTRPEADAVQSPPASPSPPVSPVPPPSSPLMAERQTIAKDRAVGANAAAASEARKAPAFATGATDATAGAAGQGATEPLAAGPAERMTTARNRESGAALPQAAELRQAAALRQAAQSGDVIGVRRQLEKRSDIDARDAGGRTALMLATLNGHLPAVEVLLGAGADANAADGDGVTPLQAAMNGNQPAIAAALRRAGGR